jgi:hypothetical protein
MKEIRTAFSKKTRGRRRRRRIGTNLGGRGEDRRRRRRRRMRPQGWVGTSGEACEGKAR